MGSSRSRQQRQRERVRARSNTVRVRQAVRDNEDGDRVPPTVEGYVQAASDGPTRVGRALIARHNRRMLAIPNMPDFVHHEILSASVPVFHLQVALVGLGASFSRPPSATGRAPVDQLMWGVDSVVAACRLALCGQFAGAAGIARSQIEAWASAKAAVAGHDRSQDHSDSDFIAAAWTALSGYERLGDLTEEVFLFDADDELDSTEAVHPAAPHRHLVVAEGREVCPAAVWGELSELVHGRAYESAALWDANCLDLSGGEDAYGAVRLVADALRVVLRSIRMSAIGLAREQKNLRIEGLLLEGMEDFSERDSKDGTGTAHEIIEKPPADNYVVPPLMHFAPLTPDEGLSPPVLASLSSDANRWHAVLRGGRPAGRLYRDDELLSIAFSWCRWRSAVSGQAALDHERRALGGRSNPRMLRFRATSWIHVTEALALIGIWEQGDPAKASLTLAASALRSGWWLWLEDDDRSMGMFRVALEHIARSRAWRLNPTRAAKLLARSSPRDWLKAAGLRRAGPLNKALGGFTHQLPWADLEAGRELLVGLQTGVDPSEAPHTARRSAAELITALAADEVVQRAKELSPQFGAALHDLFLPTRLLLAGDEADESSLDVYLEHIWSNRGSTDSGATAATGV